MNRTRVIFFAVVFVALAIVGIGIAAQRLSGSVPTTTQGPLQVRIVSALPVEPWIQEAAQKFNAEKHTQDGRAIVLTVTPMDSVTALGKWDRGEFDPVPTVWIPDSRYLVELVNATYSEKLGRDIFLSDGEYRARPLATSLFSWGIYSSRARVLQAKYGTIDWQAIHDAATAKGGWPELGGQASWGYFKLVVPNPRKNAAGLLAMVAAAGEYYDKTSIATADVTDPKFQQWLKELMGSVTDFSSLSSYSVEDLALFGYSVGDGGQLLESDLLVNMNGIQTRWSDPLVIVYPKYLTWFDFPFTIWMGSETSAAEKNAALQFEKYLLSPAVQQEALALGLRPANTDVSISGSDTLFAKWKDQGAMVVVPRTTRMQPPDRDTLQALLRWFDLNVAAH
ncbi:MAG: substrate-binding domain-containing protein [Chloroflexi bacterium]|nr:substrate-binding domain-containing protein [Chloroflexota bacterium]